VGEWPDPRLLLGKAFGAVSAADQDVLDSRPGPPGQLDTWFDAEFHAATQQLLVAGGEVGVRLAEHVRAGAVRAVA